MNHLKKMQIILLVIVLNFFFVFSSYANDYRKGWNCFNLFANTNNAKTMLHIAVKRGDIKTIAFFLNQEGVDINVRDSEGKTPLEKAVEGNKIKTADFLIRKGANIQNFFGLNYLKIAVEREYKEMAKLLIEQGVDVNEMWDIAVKRGDIKTIAFFLNQEGVDINVRDSEGKTPLEKAVEGNKIKAADFLIRKGANIQNSFGPNYLKIAVERGYKEMAKLLIEQGVDVNEMNYISYKTPLRIAIDKYNMEMVNLLISLGAEANYFQEVLIKVVENADLKQLDFLKNLSELDFKKFTIDALHIAVEKGHRKIVEFIAQNTDLNRLLNKMMDLLEIALSGKSYNKDMAELLIRLREENSNRLEKNSNYLEKISNRLGKILIAEVRRGISKEKLEYLIRLGADVNKIDNDGVALNIAVDANRPEIVESLIRAGAKLNFTDSNIETPLMRAVVMDNIEMAKLLIRLGVNINDGYYKDQKTPLIRAIEMNSIKLVKFLISQEDTDINKHDILGEVPLHKVYKMGEALKKEGIKEEIIINNKIAELLKNKGAAEFTKESEKQRKKAEEKSLPTG